MTKPIPRYLVAFPVVLGLALGIFWVRLAGIQLAGPKEARAEVTRRVAGPDPMHDLRHFARRVRNKVRRMVEGS